MPHDVHGALLKVGDRVVFLATIVSLCEGEEYCNVTLESVHGRRPDGTKETFSSINTGVLLLQGRDVEDMAMRRFERDRFEAAAEHSVAAPDSHHPTLHEAVDQAMKDAGPGGEVTIHVPALGAADHFFQTHGYRFKIVGDPTHPIETTSWAPNEKVRDEVIEHYEKWLDLKREGMVVTDLHAAV